MRARSMPSARVAAVLSVAVSILAFASPVTAQDYPSRPIRVVIPFAAGSGADIMGRFFAKGLQEQAGQPAIVENKPGNIGNLAPGLVKSARPDGYTLLFASNSNMAFGIFLMKTPPFDTFKDFVPVHALAQNGFVLTVGENSPAKSAKELAARLEARERNRYGTTSPAAVLATEAFRQLGGFQAVRVDYRNAPEAVPDLVNGTLDFMIMDGISAVGIVRSGRLRGLAVTTSWRIAALPEVPTMQEAGYAGFESAPWWAAYAPAGTPAPIVDRLAGYFKAVTSSPEAKVELARFAGAPLVHDGTWVAERIVADRKWIEPLLKAAKIEPQD